MKEKILINEKYCVVETDKEGIIIRHNNSAASILSQVSNNKYPYDLHGLNITVFSGTGEVMQYNPESHDRYISSIKGIKLLDTIRYRETESVVSRFAGVNAALSPFFDIIQLSASLYLELDIDLNIIFGTDSFWETAGAEKSELYGKSISVFTDKKNISKINSTLEIFKNNTGSSIMIEDIRFTFDGLDHQYNLEICPVENRDGFFSGIICHLQDRSYIKKCREMGKRMRRMSAIANFAGGIAHDYNNALTAVLGNLSLAKMDVEKGSEIEELLNDAESAGLKIKFLTERLGMFSRGMKPVKTESDIKNIIDNIVREKFSGYKGHYKMHVQDGIKHPEIDRVLITEALSHIIDNALDAVEGTGGDISIAVEEIQVETESVFREISLVSGRYVLISVRDNGPGIDRYSYNEIFDPYVTTKAGHEGLGLAIAYTILKRHRGFISVESSDKGGSDFKIYLPLF